MNPDHMTRALDEPIRFAVKTTAAAVLATCAALVGVLMRYGFEWALGAEVVGAFVHLVVTERRR
jgi:hypothetical protein